MKRRSKWMVAIFIATGCTVFAYLYWQSYLNRPEQVLDRYGTHPRWLKDYDTILRGTVNDIEGPVRGPHGSKYYDFSLTVSDIIRARGGLPPSTVVHVRTLTALHLNSLPFNEGEQIIVMGNYDITNLGDPQLPFLSAQLFSSPNDELMIAIKAYN